MFRHPSYGFSSSFNQEQQHGGRAKLWGGRDTDIAYVLCSELVYGTTQLEKITGVANVVSYCVK